MLAVAVRRKKVYGIPRRGTKGILKTRGTRLKDQWTLIPRDKVQDHAPDGQPYLFLLAGSAASTR